MTETPRTRTDWDAELVAACAQLESKSGKAVRAFSAYYPEPTGYAIQVGDSTPYVYPTAKSAVLRIRTWLESPL